MQGGGANEAPKISNAGGGVHVEETPPVFLLKKNRPRNSFANFLVSLSYSETSLQWADIEMGFYLLYYPSQKNSYQVWQPRESH